MRAVQFATKWGILVKTRLTLAAVFAAVLVTGACSGSGSGGSGSSTTTTTTAKAATADPVKWAGTFCSGISPSIEGAVELLKAMLGGASADPAAQQKLLLDYASKSGKSLSDAGAKLTDLGAPSADAQALHDELVKFFTDTGKQLNNASEGLAKLDPADPEFATKLEQLGGQDADPSKLQEQIKKLQEDPKLGAAFKDAPECVAMTEKRKGLGS